MVLHAATHGEATKATSLSTPFPQQHQTQSAHEDFIIAKFGPEPILPNLGQLQPLSTNQHNCNSIWSLKHNALQQCQDPHHPPHEDKSTCDECMRAALSMATAEQRSAVLRGAEHKLCSHCTSIPSIFKALSKPCNCVHETRCGWCVTGLLGRLEDMAEHIKLTDDPQHCHMCGNKLRAGLAIAQCPLCGGKKREL